jgi:non-ribosomal peptide synthetase component F
VGVLLNRCPNVYVARQGILKSGGAFVVASPDYPEDRVRFIFEDSATRFVLTTEEIKQKFAPLWNKINSKPIIIDDILLGSNDKNPEVEIKEGDLCYCIYTSGSTGKPKGVMIEHGNLSNFLLCSPKNHEVNYFVGASSVVLALAATTFDMSIMEEFISVTSGKTVVMATEEEIENPELLAETMIKYGVDGVLTTPSYLSVMLDLPKSREALKGVKVYDMGAEAFVPTLYDKIIALNKNALIINGYGPTETTISCTAKVLTSGKNITIGVPNANVYAYIIDENCNELPDGQVGELLICGKGVGRGYVNLPERTAQSFITFRGMRGYK